MTQTPATDSNPPSRPEVLFELATEADLPGIMAILNREIETSVNCFRTKPMSATDASRWWKARERGFYPAWVAKIENQVVGWSSLSRWSEYEAYAGSTEISIWVLPEVHRRKIGRTLFSLAIEHATKHRFRVIISRVESRNEASLALHDRFKFQTIGTMHRVGEKFGQVMDVVMLELLLDV
jgi:phosphinothricin acetyltransferase